MVTVSRSVTNTVMNCTPTSRGPLSLFEQQLFIKALNWTFEAGGTGILISVSGWGRKHNVVLCFIFWYLFCLYTLVFDIFFYLQFYNLRAIAVHHYGVRLEDHYMALLYHEDLSS